MTQIPAYIPPPMDPQPGRNNSLALASMISGIVAVVGTITPLCCCCWPLSLVIGFLVGGTASVLGLIALNQIKTSGEGGRGMAIAGIILGAIAVLFALALTILVIVGMVTDSGNGWNNQQWQWQRHGRFP